MSEVQTRTVKTLADKIAAATIKRDEAQVKLDELLAQQAAEAALADVNTGYVVSFEQGRAETKRTVTGTVLAAYDADGKRKVKVLAGEGATSELFEVEVAKLLSSAAPAAITAEAGDELVIS